MPLLLAALCGMGDMMAAPNPPVTISGLRQWPSDNPADTLPAAAGVESTLVFRANREHPELSDGRGWTFHHHPDMAVWRGRLYVAWSSCVKDEDSWPNRELYSTSEDGKSWSKPQELFPEGVSTPFRAYFFRSSDDVMLAYAGIRLDHARLFEKNKDGMAVRRIMPDHTLGPVYLLRNPAPPGAVAAKPKKPSADGKIKKTPPPVDGPMPWESLPFYDTAPDKDFVKACQQLIANPVVLLQQDYGVMRDPKDRMPWMLSNDWIKADGYPASLTSTFGKATSFYHRKDGAIVGISKSCWVTVSTDEGKTWSRPVRPPSLISGTAKVWGQRTADGRYALVYNPHPKDRRPLILVTSDDGVNFSGMCMVDSGTEPQRYEGKSKATGAQYVRGIAEWASDGSFAPAKNNLWVVYSINKEDIQVSRVPLPIRAEHAEK